MSILQERADAVTMKKMIAWLLAVTVCLAALAACTDSGEGTDTSSVSTDTEQDTDTSNEVTGDGESGDTQTASDTFDSTADEDTDGTDTAFSESESDFGTEEGTETAVPAFDYADSYKYVSLDKNVFVGKTFPVSLHKTVTDAELEQAFQEILLEMGSTVDVTDTAAKEGDTVKIYYQGVENVEGVEVAFEGGTYMSFGSPYSLILGSGSFIDGFEEGLIGVIPQDTYACTTDPSVTVEQDSYIHVKLNGTYYKAGASEPTTLTTGNKSKLINLSQCPYGDDFAEGVTGACVGDQLEFDCRYDADGDGEEDLVSFCVEILDLLQLHAHEVQATFPQDYWEETMAGKTVKFYVWVEAIEVPVPAEVNQELWEELGYTTDEEDVLAAFLCDLREEMQAMRDEDCRSEAVERIWEKLMESAVLSEYPANEVATMVADIKAEADYYYRYYTNYGYTFKDYNDFVIRYYSVPAEETENFDADAFFEKVAKEGVKSRMLSWYLFSEYDVTVAADELDQSVNDFLQEQANYFAQQYGQTVTVEQMAQMYADEYGENYVRQYVEESLLSDMLYDVLLQEVILDYGVEKK